MIFNVIGTMIGVLILVAGLYYLIKEKSDEESRKIYGIATLAGIIITVFMIVKIATSF